MKARDPLIENTEWLLEGGTHPEHIARLEGFRDTGALVRALEHRGATDLGALVRRKARMPHKDLETYPYAGPSAPKKRRHTRSPA